MTRTDFAAISLFAILASGIALADGWSCGSYCLGVDLSSAQAGSLGRVDLEVGAGSYSLADAYRMLQDSCQNKAGNEEGVLAANFTVSETDLASESSAWVRIGWMETSAESSTSVTESSVFVQPETMQEACIPDSSIATDSAPIVDDTFVPPGGTGGS